MHAGHELLEDGWFIFSESSIVEFLGRKSFVFAQGHSPSGKVASWCKNDRLRSP